MKKRILSMLLLVVMLVTALPLSVLPSLAVEGEEEAQNKFSQEEYDAYNELYVKNGLILAFDVMSLNSYWGEAVNARAEFPESPMTYTDYEYDANGDGTIDPKTEVYNFTDHYQRYDFDTPYYLIQTFTGGRISYLTGSANNFHHFTTYEAADAVAKSTAGGDAATLDEEGYYVKTDGNKYKAVGPYRATMICATKDGKGGYYNWMDALSHSATNASVYNSIGYASKEAAIEAVKEKTGATEPNADGGYEKGNTVYFVVGMTMNAAYVEAGTDYYTKVNAWLKKYTWIGAGGFTTGTAPASATNRFNNRRDSFMLYAACKDPVAGQGYLVQQNSFSADQGLYYTTSALANAGKSGTAEMTTRLGAGVSKEFFMFHNLRPTFYSNDNTKIEKIGNFSALENENNTVTRSSLDRNTVDTLRFTVKNNANTDFVSLEQGSTTIYSANGTYGGTDSNNIIGYSNYNKNAEIYNFRSYNRAIDEKEAAQNHFADLMKWYKIDMDLINMLLDRIPAADRYEKIYTRFEGFLMGGDDSTKAAIEQELIALLSPYLEGEYTDALTAAYAACAAEYGLDLSPLRFHPKGMLSHTYAVLNALVDGDFEGNVRAEYKKALELDLVSTQSEEYYNALYVGTDKGLLMGADFFKMNRYWNTDGTPYTLPIGPSENKAYLYDIDGNGVKSYDLTTAAGRDTKVTKEGDPKKGKTLYEIAMTEFRNAYVAFMNGNFLWTDPTGMRFAAYPNSNVAKEFAPFTLHEGYVQLRDDYNVSGGITFAGMTNTTASTMQMVSAFDGTKSSFAPAIWHHIRVTYKLSGDNVVFGQAAVHNVSALTGITVKDGVFAQKDRVYPYTQAIRLNADDTDDFYVATQLGVMAEGKVAYKTAKNDASGSGAALFNGDFHIGFYGPYPNVTLYAYRQYDRVLEQIEIEQNHFADLAKWFRLNLNGFEVLTDDEKKELYGMVKGYTLDSNRTVVQNTVSEFLQPKVDVAYDTLKTEYPTHSAFIEKAREYRLDIDMLKTVFASTEDMSKVYALTFDGCGCAAAQALLEDTYHDIVTFYVHRLVGEDDWNKWLDAVAAADPVDNIDGLLALPFAARRAITKVENNTDKDVIEGYIAKTRASYTTYSAMTEAEYNALYVQDGIRIAQDFFRLNEYWGDTDYTIPAPPMTWDDYEGNDFTVPANRMGEYLLEHTKGTTTNYVSSTNGYETTEAGAVGWAGREAGLAKAKALADAAAAKDTTGNTTVVEITKNDLTNGYKTVTNADTESEAEVERWELSADRWMVVRQKGSDASTFRYLYKNESFGLSDICTSYYTSEAEALAKAKALSGVTDAAEGATSFTSADGYTYFVLKRVTNSSYEYYKACNDWKSQMSDFYKKFEWSGIGSFTAFINVNAPHHMWAPADLAAGYLQFRSDYYASGGIVFDGLSNTVTASSSQYVSSFSYPGRERESVPFLFHNIRPYVAVSATEVKLAGFATEYFGGSAYPDETDKIADPGAVVTLTQTLSLSAAAGEDAYSLWVGDTTLVKENGNYGANDDTAVDGNNHYIAWGTAQPWVTLYAFRQYDVILTDGEILQNHFIDLAKWYRIDLADYIALEGKTAVHNAMKGFSIGDDRDAVVKAYYEAVTADYAAEAEVLSEGMLALAREYGLDVAALVAADAADRTYAEGIVLAARNVDKVTSRDILQTVLDEALLYKAAHGFNGLQVRLEGGSDERIPGVRAIFEVNKTLLEAYAARGNKVAFGVEICDAGGNALEELYFYKGEDGYVGIKTLLAAEKGPIEAAIREVGENSLAFAYTVIYGEEGQTAEYYNLEYSYRFFLEADGVRHNAEILDCGTFGDAISATEAYRYFYNDLDYTDDAVVNMVIGTVGTGLPAAE